LLLLFVAWQLKYVRQTYIAERRPHLLIRHIAFMTEADNMFTVDNETGHTTGARADFSFVVANHGATKCTIIERNITLKPIGGGDGLEAILRALHNQELPLPEFNKEMGHPLYDQDGTTRERLKLRPDEERQLRVSAQSKSIREAADMYLSLSHQRGVNRHNGSYADIGIMPTAPDIQSGSRARASPKPTLSVPPSIQKKNSSPRWERLIFAPKPGSRTQ
jgi:hypothetical protein